MSDSSPGKTELVTFLVGQYTALKAEQTARISLRENALAGNFVVVAALVTVALGKSPPDVLIFLAIPVASASIYWVYLNNDIMVTRLREFFTDEFPRSVMSGECLPQVVPDDGVGRRLALWEHFHRKDPSRPLRKAINTIVLILGFVGTSAAALFLTASKSWDAGGWIIGLWVTDMLLLLLVTVSLLLTRDW